MIDPNKKIDNKYFLYLDLRQGSVSDDRAVQMYSLKHVVWLLIITQTTYPIKCNSVPLKYNTIIHMTIVIAAQ